MSAAPAAPPADVLRGIALMCLGSFLFAANDTLGKFMLGTYTVGQLMVVRGIIALAIMLALLRRRGLPLFARDQARLQAIRFVLSPAEASLFFFALTTLPLADVTTYYLAAPIWVTAICALFFGAKVGPRRWAAVLAGFAGIVIAAHPSGRLAPGIGFAVAGSLLFSLYLVATSRLSATPRIALMGQQALATILYGSIMAPFESWAMPTATDAALLLVLALGSLAGNLCVNQALRLGPAVTIVPFQYTMLPWGVALGLAVFGDRPTAALLAGAATVITAGLYILLREHHLAHTATKTPATSL